MSLGSSMPWVTQIYFFFEYGLASNIFNMNWVSQIQTWQNTTNFTLKIDGLGPASFGQV